MDESTKVLTVRQAAKEFGFPETAIRNLIKRKAFPVIQSGTRSYIVRQIFTDYLKSGGEYYTPAS